MARKKSDRTELLNVRVSVDEKQMLAALAKIDGVTSSDKLGDAAWRRNWASEKKALDVVCEQMVHDRTVQRDACEDRYNASFKAWIGQSSSR